MTENRILSFEAIDNFRDYGGYGGADGAKVRSGVLWRSGHHGNATPADLAVVHKLGIATVIDLRGDSERAANPCLRHREFAGTVVYAPGETAGLKAAAAHEESAGEVRSFADAQNVMIRLYDAMPWRPVLVGTFKLYFAALADRDLSGARPSLLHCFAGKDRTGLAADLLHHVLGVHPDEAMADYLLTNRAASIERRIATGTHAVKGMGEHMTDDAMRALLSVRPEYLETARSAIAARHGTVDAYLAEVLALDPAQIAAIRANHLV